MHTVKSVGVMSFAKMMGAIYGALGLLFVPVLLIAGVAGMMTGERAGAFGGAAVIVMAVLFPILYGVMGFIAGAIGALLYNLFAKWTGGIELQLQAPPVAFQAPAFQPQA
jgi:hypothetical protein